MDSQYTDVDGNKYWEMVSLESVSVGPPALIYSVFASHNGLVSHNVPMCP